MMGAEHMSAMRKKRWDIHRERLKGVTQKSCSKCLRKLPLSEFHKGRGICGRQGLCKECARKALGQWRRDNPEKEKARQHRGYASMKDRVFDYYGRICNCCGETEFLFLTMDHVNNDGGGRNRAMRGWAMYKLIVASGFPDSFQVLCWNCNSGRARNAGVCPHKGKPAQLIHTGMTSACRHTKARLIA